MCRFWWCVPAFRQSEQRTKMRDEKKKKVFQQTLLIFEKIKEEKKKIVWRILPLEFCEIVWFLWTHRCCWCSCWSGTIKKYTFFLLQLNHELNIKNKTIKVIENKKRIFFFVNYLLSNTNWLCISNWLVNWKDFIQFEES